MDMVLSFIDHQFRATALTHGRWAEWKKWPFRWIQYVWCHVFHMFDRCVWQPDGQKQARVCGYVRCSGEICFWFSYRLFWTLLWTLIMNIGEICFWFSYQLFSTLVVVSCSYVRHSVGFWFDFISSVLNLSLHVILGNAIPGLFDFTAVWSDEL